MPRILPACRCGAIRKANAALTKLCVNVGAACARVGKQSDSHEFFTLSYTLVFDNKNSAVIAVAYLYNCLTQNRVPQGVLVRFRPRAPRFALSGFAWRSRARPTGGSVSGEAQAKTDEIRK